MLQSQSISDIAFAKVQCNPLMEISETGRRNARYGASSQHAKTIIGVFCATAVLIMALNIEMLRAQQWEYAYGSSTNSEDGRFRVIPVTGTCSSPDCCDGTDGYIAVGTHYDNSGDADVYVVRTDNNGATIWEYTYDITGNGDWDYGRSIIKVSDGSGFVITGDVLYSSSGDYDAYLLKIDCNGGLVWHQTYGTATNLEGGHDVVEAQTGAAGFIVCGRALIANSGTGQDGMLMRTSTTGGLIWFKAYDVTGNQMGHVDDGFYSLTQVRMVAGQTGAGGDVVTVGYTGASSKQAVVMRVAGNNGTIGGVGAAFQGVALYGTATGDDLFYSVEELQNPNERGFQNQPNVVVCGAYSDPNSQVFATNRIYVVKLDGGVPCAPLVQMTISEQGLTETAQFATTIREIRFNTASYSGDAGRYDLVMTGVRTYTNPSQAFLLSLAPGNLVPGALNGLYGGDGTEEGWSVYPVDAVGNRTFGFVICGLTTTDWDGNGDPKDMYLLKTDGFGATDCEGSYPTDTNTVTGYSCPTPTINNLTGSMQRSTDDVLRDWGLEVCPPPFPKAMPGFDLEGDDLFNRSESNGDDRRVLRSTVYPNPVRVGSDIRLDMQVSGSPTVRVSNSLGEIVYVREYSESNFDTEPEIRISTVGWNPGPHFVAIMVNGTAAIQQIMVIE